jgi:hypothetical protein
LLSGFPFSREWHPEDLNPIIGKHLIWAKVIKLEEWINGRRNWNNGMNTKRKNVNRGLIDEIL